MTGIIVEIAKKEKLKLTELLLKIAKKRRLFYL